MFFKKIFEEKAVWDLIGTAGTMGLHLVSGIIVGLAMGYFLDKWLGTDPWLLLIFLLFGIAAGFKNVYEDSKKILREQKKEDEESDQNGPAQPKP